MRTRTPRFDASPPQRGGRRERASCRCCRARRQLVVPARTPRFAGSCGRFVPALLQKCSIPGRVARLPSRAGAWGIEPLTSGVTGHFSKCNMGKRPCVAARGPRIV
jgi:hypothetical protein